MNRIAQLDIFIEIDFVFRMTISRRYSFNVCIRTIDNFHSFFGKVIDDRLAAFCDVGEVRLGDARNLSCAINGVSITVDVGHGDGTIITYGIFLRFDMTIFTFGEVLNVRVTFFSDIGETRICQIFSRKGNFTIFSTFND